MTEPTTPLPEREPRVIQGTDRGIAVAFVAVPLIAGPAIAFALTLDFDIVIYAVITVLVAIMVRAAIWHIRSLGLADPRATIYRERRDATVNTSFLAGLIIGLIIYDIVPLPGPPIWTTQQPRASFTLLTIIVYLVWASQYARIPAEVRGGWKRLLGR